MDLQYFFRGQQSKENVASAWLATLLNSDHGFRAAFLAKVGATPPGDPAASWTVDVEADLDGACDITMSTPGTFLLLEDKIADSARTEGQFRRYYEAAVRLHPEDRIIGVYLGPSAASGAGEIALVRQRSEPFAARGERDRLVPLGWKEDVPDLVAAATGEDRWFAESGLRGVHEHMERLSTARFPSAERDELRAVVGEVRTRLTERFRDRVRLARWPSIGQEALYSVKAPITMFLTLEYDEDPDPPNAIHGVFVPEGIAVTIGMSLGPSSSGRKDSDVHARWATVAGPGGVVVPGLDTEALPDRSHDRFVGSAEFRGSREALVDLLVARGTALLEFAEMLRRSDR